MGSTDTMTDPVRAPQRNAALPVVLAMASLALALAADVMLRHGTVVAWTIWLATDCLCLAAIWTSTKS